jgi:hypothetical protein
MGALVELILNFFFRCRHKHCTFPLTVGGRTYRVCLDCGREFDYDWMRMGTKKAA